MRAAIYRSYGPPEVLRVEEVEQPSIPDEDRVLVRVHAASVNPYDTYFRSGHLLTRLDNGLARPKRRILGIDVAGTVEAVGRNVRRFRDGDPVFGSCLGSHAEYVCPRASLLSLMPENATFREAAALPCVALTALQALRDVAQIKPDQKVLVYGASGGVGHMAVQLAKVLGAEVTAVCSTGNLPWVKELGADYVIDYTREDFTANGKQYDLILDAVGRRTFFSCLRSLTETGLYITEYPLYPNHPIQLLIGAWLGSKRSKGHMAKPNEADLDYLRRLVDEGKLRPVIDQCYPLDQIAAAHRHVESKRTKGKVVLVMN